MSEEMPTSVPFHYIKSNLFRVIHVDGAVGSIAPSALIFVGLYSERSAIPQIMVHDVTETGQVGPERVSERVGKTGIVREVEIGATLSMETAITLVAWLQEKIDFIQKIRKHAEQEKAKNESAVN